MSNRSLSKWRIIEVRRRNFLMRFLSINKYLATVEESDTGFVLKVPFFYGALSVGSACILALLARVRDKTTGPIENQTS